MRKIHPSLLRHPKTVKVKVTATVGSGDSDSKVNILKWNRLSKLGIPTIEAYKLKKNGKCETVDHNGTVFAFEILKDVEPQLAAQPEAEGDLK